MIDSVNISVRDLVEFILRSGDLDNRFRKSIRATEGTRGHQIVQKEYLKRSAFSTNEEYEPEVFLKHVMEIEGIKFKVSGRADGIIIEGDSVIIDEIKTTTSPLDSIKEDHNHLHWAQAKCYAYFYASKNNIDRIGVQLTYFQINNKEIKKFRKFITINELEKFFNTLINKYLFWAKKELDWKKVRNKSIKRINFPYPSYRKGQRDFAVAVYKSIIDNKNLFVQAPTGTGKTIATLFPAIKALGEEHLSRIFYLTAKNTTNKIAEDTLGEMEEKGLKIKRLTLTAKEKICFKDDTNCQPDYCEYARGHYNRVNQALQDIIQNRNQFTRDIIASYAKKYKICPFELAIDLTYWVDCIICDYNYVFDPRINLKRFFTENKGDYIFLVDEAHNLVDRSREMFSEELNINDFQELTDIMEDSHSTILKKIDEIKNYFLDMVNGRNDFTEYVYKEEPRDLYPLLNSFTSVAEIWLIENTEETKGYKDLIELYFQVQNFLRIVELFDDNYSIYIQKDGKRNNIKIKYYCLDPSSLLKERILTGKSTVFFSATLTPLDYFKNILGGETDDYTYELPSPFSNENLCLMIVNNLSTRYNDRPDTYELISEYLGEMVTKKQGNYLAFFPSYKYQNEVYERFNDKYPFVNTIIQSAEMDERARMDFLGNFLPDSDKSLLGFAVLGGIFAEGIDLKGDRLLGTAIVGVGHPRICLERDLIKKYFEQKNNRGYEYAYLYPGMNKVFQAAGRTIRSSSDRGVVLLIGERFLNYNYRKLFPSHWVDYRKVSSIKDVNEYLNKFWEKSMEMSGIN